MIGEVRKPHDVVVDELKHIGRVRHHRGIIHGPGDHRVVDGAKGLGVLPLLPNFRHFFHFHKNPSSSVISGTFSRENRFPPKPKKRPKIAKHTKHEPLPKRDAISLTFP